MANRTTVMQYSETPIDGAIASNADVVIQEMLAVALADGGLERQAGVVGVFATYRKHGMGFQAAVDGALSGWDE